MPFRIVTVKLPQARKRTQNEIQTIKVKLSSAFLLKSYFMKYPLKVLVGLYLFNVLAVGYLVYAFERANGTCTAYVDVVWMMGVTITNLGFGDFTPSFWMSRTIGKLSLHKAGFFCIF